MHRLMLAVLIIFSMTASADEGDAGSGSPCSAPTPEAASAYGLTNQTVCETLQTLDHIDIDNTRKPGYALYTSIVSRQSALVFPPSGLSNDGTGLVLTGHGVLVGAVKAANKQGYVGQTMCAKGCYAQIDMKYDPRLAPARAVMDWPAFWLWDIRTITEYKGNPNGIFNGIELDVIEAMPSGYPGQPDTQSSLHDETGFQMNANAHYSCAKDMGTNFIRDSGYHTYAMLYVPPSQNGGTGVVKSWIDGRQQMNFTFSATSAPNPPCAGGIGNANITGAFADLDGDVAVVFIKGGGSGWPVGYRNMYVWEKP